MGESENIDGKPPVIKAGEQDPVELGGFGIHWKKYGNETDDRFSIVHYPIAPKTLAAPLHYHHREDEYSYIIKGKMGALLGDEVVCKARDTKLDQTMTLKFLSPHLTQSEKDTQRLIREAKARGPWWNSGASHMNQPLTASYFEIFGLIRLTHYHRRHHQGSTQTAGSIASSVMRKPSIITGLLL